MKDIFNGEVKCYLVGGGVRDHLLNLTARDKDYVVVGATHDWMVSHNFTKIGSDFPIYLHPETNEEYALARQERKTAPGYHGFDVNCDPSITLEQDLSRRDLTINSMAMTDNGMLIDPFNGLKDLQNRTLRHTSDAFAEDPLRVLRLARFAARYNFDVAPETMQLATKLVNLGEIKNISRERIWVELMKGLSEPNPIRMIQVLDQCGALKVYPLNKYFPFGVSLKRLRKELNSGSHSIDIKFLLIMGLGISRLSWNEATTLKIPKQYYKMAFKMNIMKNSLAGELTSVNVINAINELAYKNNDEFRTIIRALKVQERFNEVKSNLSANVVLLNKAIKLINKINYDEILSDKDNFRVNVFKVKLAAVNELFTELSNSE